jgi:hypothetical protein
MRNRWVLPFVLLLPCLPVSAALAAGNPQDNGPVINFEEEVIQGTVHKPDILVQMGSSQQTLESVIYGRSHFNDFHKRDMNWRPGFIDPASAANTRARPGVRP